MIVTPFTCLVAVLWCDLFILLLTFLRQRTGFIMHFGLIPLMGLLITTVLRLFLAIEFPYTITINDYDFLNAAYHLFVKEIFSMGSLSVSISSFLLVIWIAVSAVLIIRFFVLYLREKASTDCLRRNSADDVAYVINSVAGRRSSRFSVVRNDQAQVPYIIGFFKPVIVLPESEYTKNELRLILTHEVQHYTNRDPWVKLLINILCYIMWWNPLIYILKSQLDLTLEIKCDFSVLKTLPEDLHDSYYETILNSYKAARTQAPSRACALVQSAGIKQRFILGLNYNRSGKVNIIYNIAAVCFVVIMFVASYTFVLQPASRPPDADEWGNSIVNSQEFASGYLVPKENGTYEVVMGGQSIGAVNDISVPPFSDMPIIPAE